LQYQSWGSVGGGAAAVGNPPAAPASTAASSPATAPEAGGNQSNSGIALGLAAVSPFVALLGKAISDNDDD
jgi:hypothetical protein